MNGRGDGKVTFLLFLLALAALTVFVGYTLVILGRLPDPVPELLIWLP